MNLKIKEFRELKNITRKQLASLIGCSSRTIEAYEQDRNEPNIQTLIKLADVFGVSVDSLINHDADLLDLNTLDDNRKELVKSIVYKLTDAQIAKLLINNLTNNK